MARKYITQISAKELDDMLAVSKIHAGEGIVIKRENEGVSVSIDLLQLKQWIQTVMDGGQII